MKVTLFTGNQPRHAHFVRILADIADEVFVIYECTTIFPGKVADFYTNTAVMQKYFQKVIQAEKVVFGGPNFSPKNVRSLILKRGDLVHIEDAYIEEALESDIYLVFGASFIKGWLVDALCSRKAINIHMGVSPYYRGTACNFWALYDNHPELVGATIHYLTEVLDDGPTLFHVLPKFIPCENPFEFTMRAVLSAQSAVANHLRDGNLMSDFQTETPSGKLIRNSKSKDFTDEVASNFMQNPIDIFSNSMGTLLL